MYSQCGFCIEHGARHRQEVGGVQAGNRRGRVRRVVQARTHGGTWIFGF